MKLGAWTAAAAPMCGAVPWPDDATSPAFGTAESRHGRRRGLLPWVHLAQRHDAQPLLREHGFDACMVHRHAGGAPDAFGYGFDQTVTGWQAGVGRHEQPKSTR